MTSKSRNWLLVVLLVAASCAGVYLLYDAIVNLGDLASQVARTRTGDTQMRYSRYVAKTERITVDA